MVGVVKTFRVAGTMSEPSELSFDDVGDSAWGQYAACMIANWNKCRFQRDLLSTVGDDRNAAIVMWWHFQNGAMHALMHSRPAIGGETSADCLRL